MGSVSPRQNPNSPRHAICLSCTCRLMLPPQVVADFYYVYKFPSFLVAGLEGLAWAFNERPPQPIVHRTANSEVRRNGEAVEGGQARKGGSVEGQRLNAASDSADKRGGSESSSESYWRQPNWRPPSVLVFNMGIFWSIQGGDNLEDVMETMFKWVRLHVFAGLVSCSPINCRRVSTLQGTVEVLIGARAWS